MNPSELSIDVIERSREARGKHIIFFDGVCGLCNKSVQFVLDQDTSGSFYFASLQSQFAKAVLNKFGVDPTDLDSIHVIENYDTEHQRLYIKSDAALFVMRNLGGWKAVIGSLTWIPKFIRDGVYRFIATIRYNVFGKSDTCRLPDQNSRRHFIEV